MTSDPTSIAQSTLAVRDPARGGTIAELPVDERHDAHFRGDVRLPRRTISSVFRRAILTLKPG